MTVDRAELRTILSQYLDGAPDDALVDYLTTHSNLPGPRANLALIGVFADLIGEALARPNVRADRIEALLSGWAALPLANAPVNHPRELLPALAAAAYGQVAVTRPEWWDDELAWLRRLAADPRWRTRELVAAGLQRMLAADWDRTCAALVGWASSGEPLVTRAAVAAVAEPSLLAQAKRAEDALAVQAEAVSGFLRIPPERRRDEDVRTLRQALGYTLSVVTAASPETGFHLMEELAALPDPDVVWIVRENLKKKRLARWPKRLDTLETALLRPDQADED